MWRRAYCSGDEGCRGGLGVVGEELERWRRLRGCMGGYGAVVEDL